MESFNFSLKFAGLASHEIFDNKMGSRVASQITYGLQHGISPCERITWLLWLRQQKLEAYPVSQTSAQLLIKAIELADWLEDWSLLLILRRQLHKYIAGLESTRGLQQNAIDNCYQTVVTLIKTGNLNNAEASLRNALLHYPEAQQLTQSITLLQQRQCNISYHPDDCSNQLLTLIPLDYEHYNAFIWQFYEPSIAELCNLPNFASEAEWRHWLHQNQSQPDQRVFALIHDHWGFVGSVCLRIRQNIGFFYFWLGKDFQGKQLGPQALQTLLYLGEHYHQISACYACAFAHNRASISAMHKLKFSMLPFTFSAPDDNQRIYYRGKPKTLYQHYVEIHEIFNLNDEKQLIPLSTITSALKLRTSKTNTDHNFASLFCS
ncbi:GNAT family N-acetyltransferase [Agarivorans sp. QJM3NY_33]|uniref:GNAT family N-acetyltransferase n=1 Tax=Agarivorans sp. QJM3NY_33 TaxID=3421432 RepID=UPI003D7E4077